MATFNADDFNRKLREAQRKAEQQIKVEVDKINRANKKAIEDYNRKVNAHNKKVISDFNNKVRDYNRKAEVHNKQIIAEINRQLRSPSNATRFSELELQLTDRVHTAISALEPREYDAFLSYARIDGAEVAKDLQSNLKDLGVSVWYDEVSIVPGRSQSLQMDAGLRKARSGVALLTPAYLTGRFWTERELGALLGKSTLIPVLHNVSFEDVKEYSGILPDLAGFTTARDTIETIAKKIAATVLIEEEGA